VTEIHDWTLTKLRLLITIFTGYVFAVLNTYSDSTRTQMSLGQIRHGTHWKRTTSKLRATQDMEQQPHPSTDGSDSPTDGHTPTAVDGDAEGPVLLSEELLIHSVLRSPNDAMRFLFRDQG
jgi:hypothetical protein